MIRNRTLAMTALAILVGATALAREASHPTGEMPHGILHYEPVALMSPMAATNQAGGAGAAQTAQLSFSTLGRQFDLLLEAHDPFAPGAKVHWVHDGGAVDEPLSGGPYFRGRVDGDPTSWVRITMQGDAMAGIVATADEVYVLEPAVNLVAKAAADETLAYRLSDTDTEWVLGSCAARAPSSLEPPPPPKMRDARRALHEFVGRTAAAVGAAGSLKEADIGMVADYEYFNKHGAASATSIAAILNSVDGFYEAELGVAMHLRTIVVYTTPSDPFSSDSNPNSLLPEFSNWRKVNDDTPSEWLYGTDLTHLITARDLDSNIIGIAYIGGLCDSTYGVGVDQDFSTSPTMMALLLSHEMGHNFGAYHDNQQGSPCASTPGTFIMNPSISASLQQQFSPCSKTSISPVVSGVSCLADTQTPPPGLPVLDPITQPIVVGGTLTLTGANFTPGSVLKLFIATSSGTVSRGPYSPGNLWTSSKMIFTQLDPTIPLGRGFATVMVINTDQGYVGSNTQGAYLYGSAAANIPTITAIGGLNLRPFDIKIPLASVETVVPQGQTVTITGTGFNSPLVNLFTASGNKGPLTPLAGGTSTQIRVTIPADTPTGPGSFQVVNSPYTGNVSSNAVSVPIGAQVTISDVTQVGSMVTVTGTGFSTMSVINLFNGGANLGGIGLSGVRIHLTVDSDQMFHFVVPAGAVSGSAYVQVLNPPYIPYSTSGNDPDGGFFLTAQ
jgi:Reprolysin (M12B) family zinc metalloprotease/IPT/TIG domain